MHATDFVTFGGPIGAGTPLNTLTVANSGGATLAGSLDAGTLSVQNTTGAVAVEGDTTLTTGLLTVGMPYDLLFTGTTNSIAGGTVFRNTGVEGAQLLAERIRGTIEETLWPLGDITVSIGIAAGTQATPTPSRLIDAADRALYDSKEAGRNQVASTVSI